MAYLHSASPERRLPRHSTPGSGDGAAQLFTFTFTFKCNYKAVVSEGSADCSIQKHRVEFEGRDVCTCATLHVPVAILPPRRCRGGDDKRLRCGLDACVHHGQCAIVNSVCVRAL